MQLNYPNNVRFTCSKCGLCCGDTPNKTRHVLLSPLDAQKIAAETNQPIGKFAKPIMGKKPYVFEMNKTTQGGCVFLRDNKCIIYEARPLICRFYPFELQTNENGVYVFRATDECPGVSSANTETAKTLDRQFFEALLKAADARLCGCPGSDL